MVDVSSTPIRKTVVVPLGPEEAFELFTARIGEWWPTATHSIHGDRVAEVVVEGQSGGRILERTGEGEEALWAHITAWEPPSGLVLDWMVDPGGCGGTEVEVRFTPEGDGTRVELVHRGWERLGERAEAQHRSYAAGWDHVLGFYSRAGGA